MCGIAGYANIREAGLLERMGRTLTHRGPDDEECYRYENIGLYACRLAIVDIASGHQPMSNEVGTIWVVYNGEIYNHEEIVIDLQKKGHRFRTRCDTEVVIHAYEEWGNACVERFNGMFAFVIHDRQRGLILMARDRLGIKPLYYWHQGGRLIFASEIKAILECPQVSREVERFVIPAYLALRYVPGPQTMFRQIFSLPPAHIAVFEKNVLNMHRYWYLPIATTFSRSIHDYQEEFEERFERSVRLRLMSDVPVGAFLSGGVDSSLVVAVMARANSIPIRTFTVGFDSHVDEVDRARRMAVEFGCEHQEIICRRSDLALLPKLIWHLDQPQGDSILLPLFRLANEASHHVKVVLTGEGADEILGGYLFHKVMVFARFYQRAMPRALRCNVFPLMLSLFPIRLLNTLFRYPPYLGQEGKARLKALTKFLGTAHLETWYTYLRSLFTPDDLQALCRDGFWHEVALPVNDADDDEPFVNRMLGLQYRDWLPENMLYRLDRMTMAASIEGRVPFLDHTLVEFLATAPPALKIWGLRDKRAARTYAAKVLPVGVASRPKKPFYIPVEEYVGSKELTELVAMTLNESRVRRRGYFHYSYIRHLIERQHSRDFLIVKQILALTQLELWHMIFIDRELAFE